MVYCIGVNSNLIKKLHLQENWNELKYNHQDLWYSPDVGRGFEMRLYPKGECQKTYYSLKYNYTHDWMDPQWKGK